MVKEAGLLGKFRNETYSKMLTKEVDFKHIIYNECHRQMFTDEQIKVISIAEFVKYYERNSKKINYVIFDGALSDENRESLDQLLYPLHPKIIIEPKADRNYKLVNDADAIAHFLYKYYATGNCKKRMDFFDKIVTPRIEDYGLLLKNKYLSI